MRKALQQLRIRPTKKEGDVVLSNDFPQGIVTLADPKDAVFHIVFTHALTDDRERTWTHPASTGPWPKDLLRASQGTNRNLWL